MRSFRSLAGALLTLLTVLGCAAPTETPNPVGTTSGSAVRPFAPVTLTRSGGLAGDRTELRIEVDGNTTRTSNGQEATGQLPPQTLDRLRGLLTGTQIAAEAAQEAPLPLCADSFTSQVRMGALVIARGDCNDDWRADAPALAAVLDLLQPYLAGPS